MMCAQIPMMPKGVEHLLTVKQFADQYKIYVKTVYRHIKLGLLPSVKIGSTYLIDSKDIEQYQKSAPVFIQERKKARSKNANIANKKRREAEKTGKII